jgi:predicted polyphosphate/ATP-dependent NAD kinase
MSPETFPEIQAATEALQKRITLTEAEVAELKETIKKKKALVPSWRKALAAFTPSTAIKKKKTAA